MGLFKYHIGPSWLNPNVEPKADLKMEQKGDACDDLSDISLSHSWCNLILAEE